MKIALVTYALQTGGVESFLRTLWRCLAYSGHEVDFVETSLRGNRSDHLRLQNCRVLSITPKRYESKVKHARRLANILSNYNVLFLNDVPSVQSALGLLPETTVVIPVLHTALVSMIRVAIGNEGQWDKVVTVSPGLRRILIQHFGVPKELVITINNAVVVPETWSKKDFEITNEASIRVAYIGRIEEEQKAVLLLPEIFKKALAKQQNIRFDIVGDGPDLEELKSRVVKFCPEAKVCFHGVLAHSKTLELLIQQDILIMPSRYEGHPIVLLEALAAGVVPIVSRLLGYTDHVVQPGKNGYLCEIDDVQGFASALVHAAADRANLLKLSESGWRMAKEEFSWQQMGQRYLQLIHDLNERKKGAPHERSGVIDIRLLDDLPSVPICLIRPIRKTLKVLGMWGSQRQLGGLFKE